MKVKLNTKIIMYFSLTSILLACMFFSMTNYVISSSFNRYRQEKIYRQDLDIVDYIQNVYKENRNLNPYDLDQLKHIIGRGGYYISFFDNNKKLVWKMEINRRRIPNITTDNNFKSIDYLEKRYEVKLDNKLKGYINIARLKTPPMSQEDFRFKNRLYKGLIITSIIGLSITIIIGSFLAKQISKPILKIKDTADILRNGELSARVDLNVDTKEIEDLNRSINYLASSLEEQETLRKRLTSDISHELRTPLNVLQNQIEALIDGIWEATPDKLNICYDEIIRLTELVKNLEKLTKLDEAEISLKKETIVLNDLIKSVINQFEPIFKEKNINLSFDDNKTVKALVDKNKFKQILINMLSNANKFTNQNGEINISLSKKDKKAIIQIKDNGIGISEDDIPYIFERFYRSENSESRKIKGVGLGLSIVKSIVEAHNGKIYVQSTKGVGTLFTIEIPV